MLRGYMHVFMHIPGNMYFGVPVNVMLVCRVCVRSKFQESSKKDGGGERWTSPRWRRCPTSLFFSIYYVVLVLLFFFFLFSPSKKDRNLHTLLTISMIKNVNDNVRIPHTL